MASGSAIGTAVDRAPSLKNLENCIISKFEFEFEFPYQFSKNTGHRGGVIERRYMIQRVACDR